MAASHDQGCTLVGFARLKPLKARADFFQQRIDEGLAGDMGWLAREPERRFDPRRLDTCLRPVKSLACPRSRHASTGALSCAAVFALVRARPRPSTTQCSRGPA